MKNYLIISLLILSVGFPQQEYNSNDLIEMDNGLFTVKFSDEPITGMVYGYFGEVGNLKKVNIGNVLNGKKEGKWVEYYHSTGRKMYEHYYKDGVRDGLHTSWYENGKKKIEGTFKDDKHDGLHTTWYENGQMKIQNEFKDGNLVFTISSWNEDGSVKE